MPSKINNKSVYTPGGLTGVLNKNSALAPAKTNGPFRCMCSSRKAEQPTGYHTAAGYTACPSPTTSKVIPFQEGNIALGRLSPNAAVLGRPCGARVLLIAGSCSPISPPMTPPWH